MIKLYANRPFNIEAFFGLYIGNLTELHRILKDDPGMLRILSLRASAKYIQAGVPAKIRERVQSLI